MSEQKKPEIGEWWEYNGVRIYIAGITTKGLLPCEYKDGTISVMRQGDYWKHLPDCDSFDWQPETFPQWIVSGCDDPWIAHAYLKRISSNTYERYLHNGEKDSNEIWGKHEADFVTGGWWKQVTQAEAEARVKKPEPVESPDDWVTQDRVVRRPGIDECRWVSSKDVTQWRPVRDSDIKNCVHGYNDAQSTLEVRCRRKDLPAIPETPDREYVRLWLAWGNCRVYASTTMSDDPKDREIKHDGKAFYLEGGK